jgi:hypothetical protein
MAALFCTLETTVNPGNPETLLQIKAPTHQRLRVTRIDFMPQGATGASSPIKFEIAEQNDDGSSSDASTDQQKHQMVGSETMQATSSKDFTVEPATNTVKYGVTLHQQAYLPWIPPNGEIIVPGGGRLGVRCMSTISLNVTTRIYWEE